MTSRNRISKFAQAVSLFALIAVFAAAAFPSASYASAQRVKNPPATGKISLLVVDQITGAPIDGAIAYFRTSNSVVTVAKGQSGADGLIELELRATSYVVEIRAHNYKSTTETIDIAAGIRTQYKVGLYPNSILSDPPPPMLSID
jgi:hypothetical protein